MNALIQEQWRPEPIDLDQLSKMPEGSLGKIFATNLLEEGFDPKELTEIDPYPINSDREYLLHRNWQTHDILHTLTGFNVNTLGELGLQAYSFANCRQPMHLFIMTATLFKAGDSNVEAFEIILSAIMRGFTLGVKAPPLMSFKFEEGWDRPISEWREEVNLPNEPSIKDSAFMRLSDFL